LGTLEPERLLALRKVATIESIGSSTRIEGSKLTDKEVERLLGRIELQSFSTRDEQEVAGYSKIMETIFTEWPHIPVSEGYIRQLHRDLLMYSEKDAWHRGNYKTTSNSVAAFDENGNQLGIVFQTASPFDTPFLMQELVHWFNQERDEKRLHPLLATAIFTVVFLEIHPFQDGNGRLSRALSTLILLQTGYDYVPYSSLESIIEQTKESYYLALRQTQETIRTDAPDWQPWLVYFLRSLKAQKDALHKKVEREQSLALMLPAISLGILEYLKQHGRISIGEYAALSGISRNTLKQHFRNLSDKGFIVKRGAGRSAWYAAS
jgi:Fic family protein